MEEAKLLIKSFPFVLYIKEKMYVQYAQAPFPSFLYTDKDKDENWENNPQTYTTPTLLETLILENSLVLPVDVAALPPSSFTSKRTFCMTLET